MDELIDFVLNTHENAPPFISQNEDGSYTLIGQSDLATGKTFDYGTFGKCKLTAKNHSNTLLRLMAFLLLVDELDDKELLDLEDEEVVFTLEQYFSPVLSAYFGKEVEYSSEIGLKILNDNPQIVNEAIYNVTKDKDEESNISLVSPADRLEGTQFKDPYTSIAYEVAKDFSLRPFEVIEEWATSELIVAFSKYANDRSLDSFLNYKYSQPKAPKPKPPQKQIFYFAELGDEEDE